MDPPAPLRRYYASWSWSPLSGAVADWQATTERLLTDPGELVALLAKGLRHTHASSPRWG
jgi:hypothetical protein